MDGIKDFTLSDKDDLLDTTDFVGANASRTRSRLVGLRDATLSLSGDLEFSDTGFANCRAAKRSGSASAAFQVWFNTGTSSAGFALVAVVESIEFNGNVEGKAEVKINASVNGVVDDPM
jgi:hypothetical protein